MDLENPLTMKTIKWACLSSRRPLAIKTASPKDCAVWMLKHIAVTESASSCVPMKS
jgi:hypothetical protein